jgi:putative membrane protein
MNSQSVLQQQHPLSPRKFWKKMIEKLGALYIIGIIVAVVILIIIFSAGGTDASMILWGVLGLGLVILLLISFLYGWYVKVYIRRYYYDGEEHFITIKKGVFAPTEIHVQWQKIQDVYVDQDILDRIMGLYDVHIASATASSGIEAHIDGVEEAAAEGLKKFLLNKVSGAGKGNVQSTNQAQPLAQTDSPQSQVSKVNLSENISSKTYPLLGKWTTVTLISRILGSFAYSALLVLIFFGKSESAIDIGLLVLGWIALGILITIIRIVALFLWKHNYAFDFTSEHIYYKEGIISLSEKHMPYSSVQNVTVKQGVIERIFGLAKVVIENAAQQPVVVGRNGQQVVGSAGIVLQGLSLADANKIANILKTIALGKNSSGYGL